MGRLLCLIILSFALLQNAVAEESGRDHISDYLTHKFGIARAKAEQISEAVQQAASKYSLPPALLLAIISIESRFRDKARGPHGATGLMQVVPAAHRGLLRHVKDLTEPAANIEAGSAILHGYLQSAGGDLDLALKSYGGSMAYAEKVSLRVETFEPVVAQQAEAQARAQPASCDGPASGAGCGDAPNGASFFVPATAVAATQAAVPAGLPGAAASTSP
jgi:soluble lytic murein transglycosylase-like protein